MSGAIRARLYPVFSSSRTANRHTSNICAGSISRSAITTWKASEPVRAPALTFLRRADMIRISGAADLQSGSMVGFLRLPSCFLCGHKTANIQRSDGQDTTRSVLVMYRIRTVMPHAILEERTTVLAAKRPSTEKLETPPGV